MAEFELCFWFGVLTLLSSPIVKKFVTARGSQSLGDVIAMEHEAINHDQELVNRGLIGI